MAESREERLRSALNELVSRSAEVDAAAVVSMDGLVMASVLPNTLEEDRLGAMSAALLSLGERTSEESNIGRRTLAVRRGGFHETDTALVTGLHRSHLRK